MTKQHFETAAEIVREMHHASEDNQHADAVRDAFIRLFSRYNGRFDSTRFRDACAGRDSSDSAGRRVRYSR